MVSGFSSTIGDTCKKCQIVVRAWVTKMTRIDSPPIATGKINLCVIPAGFPVVMISSDIAVVNFNKLFCQHRRTVHKFKDMPKDRHPDDGLCIDDFDKDVQLSLFEDAFSIAEAVGTLPY